MLRKAAQPAQLALWPPLGGSVWVTLPGSRWASPGGSASPTPVAQYGATADKLLDGRLMVFYQAVLLATHPPPAPSSCSRRDATRDARRGEAEAEPVG